MEPFSLLKFFAGFNIFSGARLGKLVFYFILIAIAIGVYHNTFLKRTVQQNIKAENVTIEASHNEAFVFLKFWKLRILSIE